MPVKAQRDRTQFKTSGISIIALLRGTCLELNSGGTFTGHLSDDASRMRTSWFFASGNGSKAVKYLYEVLKQTQSLNRRMNSLN